MVSLCGCHLLGKGLLGAVVARSFEALAFERVEVDPVGLVGDEQVEHGPDQGQAAGLAGEAAHHLSASFDLAERALEAVGKVRDAARREQLALERERQAA
jgi:hypothetical protein